VMYSFTVSYGVLVLRGSFRSSASVVMRSSASVCVSCLISIHGSVSEFMLSVFICGIVVVLLTLIVHFSSVVVAACRATLGS